MVKQIPVEVKLQFKVHDSVIVSPQTKVCVAPIQPQGSIMQFGLHPSPGRLSPSSHSSPGSRFPSPQYGSGQVQPVGSHSVQLQSDPAGFPLSHSSPESRFPFPQQSNVTFGNWSDPASVNSTDVVALHPAPLSISTTHVSPMLQAVGKFPVFSW